MCSTVWAEEMDALGANANPYVVANVGDRIMRNGQHQAMRARVEVNVRHRA